MVSGSVRMTGWLSDSGAVISRLGVPLVETVSKAESRAAGSRDSMGSPAAGLPPGARFSGCVTSGVSLISRSSGMRRCRSCRSSLASGNWSGFGSSLSGRFVSGSGGRRLSGLISERGMRNTAVIRSCAGNRMRMSLNQRISSTWITSEQISASKIHQRRRRDCGTEASSLRRMLRHWYGLAGAACMGWQKIAQTGRSAKWIRGPRPIWPLAGSGMVV